MPESPVSNPLAPPNFKVPSAPAEKPLSNADFRKIMMTPRATPSRSGGGNASFHNHKSRVQVETQEEVVDDDPDRPTSNPVRPVSNKPKTNDEDAAARAKARQKWQQKNKEKEKEVANTPKYRDRAKERRDDANPDYLEDEAQLSAFNSVAPTNEDKDNAELQKISIDNSKFLGGDMEHTHLVKGLDFALLNKIKIDNAQKEKEDKEKAIKDLEARKEKDEMKQVGVQQEHKAPTLAAALGAKKPDLLAPSAGSAIAANTVLGLHILNYLKPQPQKNEMFQPGRMAFIFDMDSEFAAELPTTLVRSREDAATFTNNSSSSTLAGKVDPILVEKVAKVMNFLRQGGKTHTKKIKKKEKIEEVKPVIAPVKPPVEEDDIFGDVGTDYVVSSSKPTIKDEIMEDKVVEKKEDKSKYFQTEDKEDNDTGNTAKEALQQAKLLVAAVNAKAEKKEGKEGNKQSEKTAAAKAKDLKEKDPNFVGDTYTECYPGSFETAMYAYESDDEEDITKMDMGGSKKKNLKRWDFDDEESWNEYNDQREAMPKAAFQFGVKMQDGRKTRRNTKESKINQDVKKINTILKQRAVDGVQAKKHAHEGGHGNQRGKRQKHDDD